MDLVRRHRRHRRGTDGQRRLRNAQIERQRGEAKTKAAVPGSWVRFPPSVGRPPTPPCSSDPRVQSSLSGGDFERKRYHAAHWLKSPVQNHPSVPRWLSSSERGGVSHRPPVPKAQTPRVELYEPSHVVSDENEAGARRVRGVTGRCSLSCLVLSCLLTFYTAVMRPASLDQ